MLAHKGDKTQRDRPREADCHSWAERLPPAPDPRRPQLQPGTPLGRRPVAGRRPADAPGAGQAHPAAAVGPRRGRLDRVPVQGAADADPGRDQRRRPRHARLRPAPLRPGVAEQGGAAAVGYTKDTPEPPGGEIQRDKKGNPTGLWRLPHQPTAPDGLGHAILAPAPPVVPLVFPPRVRPRPAVRPAAGVAARRGGPGPRPADGHELDPGGRAERRVPPVLHHGRRPPGSGPTSSPPAWPTRSSSRWWPSADRLTFALDDTPTERYGRHVQGAGVHHNPTPGPAGGPFVYGHVWVVLGLLAAPPGVGRRRPPAAGPAVRPARRTSAGIDPRHRPAFRTKLELAVELMRWAVSWLGFLGKPLWVVADGAYAKAPFLKPMRALGGDGGQPAAEGRGPVDRARAAAAAPARAEPDLRGAADRPGQAGRAAARVGDRDVRPCTGSRRRSGTRRSWRRGGRPAGAIRVVLVDEPNGWVAFFCTDPAATRGRHPRVRRRPLLPGDRVPGLQGSRRGGPAAGAVRVGERRGVPRLPVDVHDDRGVGVGPGRGGAGRATGPRRPWDDEPRRPSHADKRRATGDPTRRDFIRSGVGAGLVCAPEELRLAPWPKSADLILHDGRIATLDPRAQLFQPWPSRTESCWRWAATRTCWPTRTTSTRVDRPGRPNRHPRR